MYQATTRSLTVSVTPEYLADQSNPREGHFVWAYHIIIENKGEITVQLLSRHWCITDALGRTQEVKGAGVVGEQPVLRPGESFKYSSGTPLTTASGIMAGTYHMETVDGERFDITIPAFSLDSPYSANAVH